MNKRIRTIAKKSFKERFIAFFPNVKVPGLPQNTFLRILVLLLSYFILAFFSFAISQGMAFIFLGNGGGNEVEYFMATSMIVLIMLFIFSFIEVVGEFYSSKDTSIMLSLPIKEEEIFIGKFLGNISTNVDYYIFLVMILINFFRYRPFDPIIMVFAIIAYAALIIMTYSLVCLIVMLVMRFTNAGKHKTFFKFLGYGILVALMGLYYYYIFSTTGNLEDSQDPDSMIFNKFAEISPIFANIVYPTKLFALGVFEKNIFSILALVLIAAVMIFIVKKLAGKIYLDSIIEKNGSAKSRKKQANKKQTYKKSSQTMAIARKELANIINNPVFLLQNALFVVMIIGISFSISKNLSAQEMPNQAIGQYLSQAEYIFVLLAFGLLMGQFVYGNNVLPFTSLSREGKSFYISQTLPIEASSNILGRALAILLIDLISTALMSLAFLFIFKLSFLQAFAIFLGMMISATYISFYGLYRGSKKIDIHRQKPQEVTKTGIYGVFMTLLSLVIFVVICALSFGLYYLSENLIASIGLALLLILIAALFFYLLGEKSYEKGFMDI